MVVVHHFQDILDSLDKIDVLSLPKLKEKLMNIEFMSSNEVDESISTYTKAPLPFASSEIFNASIIKWRRLTSEDVNCKAVYEITFDIEGSNIDFIPGDTVGIIPHNDENDLQQCIEHLDLNNIVDNVYTLSVNGSKGKIPLHVPAKSTLRHVLSNCVDLRGIVKKLSLLALSQYTKDENEKRVLEYLCSKEGSVEYTTLILNKNVTLLDIFTKFKSCKPPIEVILEHLPRLLPRPYSVVNSRHANKDVIKICFSVISVGNDRKGLTTGWLEKMILKNDNIEDQMENLSLNKTLKIPIYLRKNINEFCLPQSSAIPLILIGPGTGVAPFIAFLEEREYLKRLKPEKKFGFVWLFFGCRDPKLDFIYEDELKTFASNGVINKLSTAFSRVTDSQFCYVQECIKENGEEFTQLIIQGAHVYVCGDIKTMATQVKDTVVQVLEKNGNMNIEEATNFVLKMQKEKRYINDIWN